MRLDYEYNHDARTQSPRLAAARPYHTRVHTEQAALIVLDSDVWLKKIRREAPRHVFAARVELVSAVLDA